MPSWAALPPELRWMLVYYIKTFDDDFADPEYDPRQSIVTMPPRVPSSPASIARGRKIFEKNKCPDCHGRELRGDGRNNLRDEWGYPARVANLTRGWNFKGGSDPEDIIYRFTTGLDGTAMRGYEERIVGEDRWHLANYLASVARGGFDQEMIFKAERTAKKIPLDAGAEIWRSMAPTKIFIQGQTIVEPFWINNSVDMVEVRALYNEDEIGFLVEWDDPVQDAGHQEQREVAQFQGEYVKAFGEIPREPGVFRDAIALQFPVKPNIDRRVRALRGGRNNPVNLWTWKSDLAEKQANAVEESNSWGPRRPVRPQPATDQQVRSKAAWKDGRWRVVMVRPLQTRDENDVQFAKDGIIPMAVNVWDGSNGEHGLIMGLSPWLLVYLDDPASNTFGRIRDILWFFDVSREFSYQ